MATHAPPTPAPAPVSAPTPAPVSAPTPAPVPNASSEAKEKSWYNFWSGGARKSKKVRQTKKAKARVTAYFRQVRVVNGKVYMNREMRCVTKGRRLSCKMTRRRRSTRKH